jgi:predicted transcriptional regulator
MQVGILGLTAQIVSAHSANTPLAADQLPAVIRVVYRALAAAGLAPVEAAKPQSAVTVEKSVFADHIICLDCGKSFKMLKRHLSSDHQTTPEEYRTKWELPTTYPLVSPEYAATRSRLAKANGLGRKLEKAPRKSTGPTGG